MLSVETTAQSAAVAATAPARLAPLTQAWLPRTAGWHGTTLSGIRLARAIDTVSETFAGRGIGHDSVVVLESDDSGRTFLAFLALVDRGARVILASEGVKLPAGGERATHTVVLRDATRDEIDIRVTLRRIEHDAHRDSSDDLSETVGARVYAWFGRRQVFAIASSGTTTGAPTLVWKDGPDLVENAIDTARAAGYGATDVFLPLLPLAGQYGSSVMVIATVLGAGIVFSNRTKVTESLRTIARAGVTATDAAPLLYRRILDELVRQPENVQRLASVRVFGVGGEGLSAELAEEFRRVTGRELLNGYGLAQLGNVGFCRGTGNAEGFHLVATFRARVLGPEGEPASDGTVGRVQIARRDREPFVHLDGAEWFDTGDIGTVRGDVVEIAGREGAVNRNGTLIHLAWIEKQLAEQGIRAVAVPEPNSAKHRYWLVIADSIRRPARYWRNRIDALLGAAVRPDRIQTLAALPEDVSGKASRARLNAFVAELSAMRAGGRAASDSPAGRLRAKAESVRAELTDLIAGVSDPATAVRDMRSMLNALDHAGAELALHGRPPAVPVDVFMTRNAILECFAVYCLIPSLWASVVTLRPATGTEHIVRRLVEIFGDVTDDRLCLETTSHETFTAMIASRPSVVLFTGRRSNAETVLQRLSRRHVMMFFGRGVNPVVVGSDADIEVVARETVAARLYNGGQDCLAPDLILAHESVADDLIDALRRAAETYVRACGGSLAPLVQDETMLGTVRFLLENADGIVAGGHIDYARRHIDPTIVRISCEQALEPVEHFAPIMALATFTHDTELHSLIASERHREYGFGMSLYGWDEERARLLGEHFMVSVDQPLADAVGSFEPFGGHGVESGFIVEGGRRRLGPINITQSVVGSDLARRKAM